jgi:hypothetical protein
VSKRSFGPSSFFFPLSFQERGIKGMRLIEVHSILMPNSFRLSAKALKGSPMTLK